jgi:uncharacterized coiled-coil protein SlyX
MATLREIANKGAELKTAIDNIESLKQDKQTAQDRITAINLLITAAQAEVDRLQVELKALL